MEMINNDFPLMEPLYSSEATKMVDRYRQMIHGINHDDELNESEQEALLVEAGQWYEAHVRNAGFTDHQIAWAWFANSSEDEWPDPDWSRME